MTITPTLQDEAAFISGVLTNGKLAQQSYWGWGRNTPATYSSTYDFARKWGGTTAGSAGGTVYYYFDPSSNWSATEQAQFTASLALWSAVANITFVQTTTASQAQIDITRGHDGGSWTSVAYSAGSGACQTGGTVLAKLTGATVSIDTSVAGFGPINGNFSAWGGYPVETVLHELGHALGLGHAGPYNGDVNVGTQQYSAYDTRQWSIMSYIQPETSGAKYASQYTDPANYHGNVPTTWMPADILAIQSLYGVAVNTPLSGGQVFGFHCNIAGPIEPYFDFTKNTKPIITIWDKGTGNTLDLSGFTGSSVINLNPGTFSSTSGLTDNIAIAFDTKVDTLVCSAGGSTVTCNNDGDTIYGGAGNDTIITGLGNDVLCGAGGNDTVRFSGDYTAYAFTCCADGTITVTGSGGTDLLSGIETLAFADCTVTAASITTTSSTGSTGGTTSTGTGGTSGTSGTGSSTASVTDDPSCDFNNDGKSDIVLVNASTNQVKTWLMNGRTPVRTVMQSGPNTVWSCIGVGDFNADGKADILWQNTSTGQMQYWQMNGTTKAAVGTIGTNPGAGWNAVAIGDFNDDGKADIVLAKGDQVSVWLMNKTVKLSDGTFSAPSGFTVVGTGDFNGDGTSDILWQNTSSGALEIWTMKNGQPTSEDVLASNPGSGWLAVGTGDFNADGKADILLQNTNGQAAIWFMDGTTELAGSGNISTNLGSDWKAVGTGDYDGNGTSDILFQQPSTGKMYMAFMSGTNVLSTSSTLIYVPGSLWGAVTG